MATVIKASCHDCGDVELAVSDLEVRVCTQDEQGTLRVPLPDAARCRS